MIDCRAYSGAQIGSEHGPDNAMVRARVRLRIKAALISNLPAKFVTAKLKTVALEHLRLDVRNHFEGFVLEEDVSPEDEWQSQRRDRKHFPGIPRKNASSPSVLDHW